MEGRLSCFDLAENDCQFLEYDREHGQVGNIMCFSTQYPGGSAFLVSEEDVDDCWEAVEETRDSVLCYFRERDS